MEAKLRPLVLALLVVALIVVALPLFWMVAMMVAMGIAMPFGMMGGAFWPMLVLWSLVLVGLVALLAFLTQGGASVDARLSALNRPAASPRPGTDAAPPSTRS